MNDVVDLPAYRLKREQRRAAEAVHQTLEPDAELPDESAALVGELMDLADRLTNLAVNSACEGPWKKWADAQPEGTVLKIDHDRLLACGDVRVLALMDLVEHVGEAIARIERGEI